jgi:hypothetical protein
LLVSTTRPLESLHLQPRRLRDEVKALADAIENGSTHGRFPGVNWLFDGAFRLKRWTRGHNTNPSAAAPQPVADRLLAYDESARAVRWITGSVTQSRIVSTRRRNYALLGRLLSSVDAARAICASLPADAAPYVFPLYVDDPQASYQRLRAAGVPIFRWDEVWPGTPVIASDYGVAWATHVFQLGCHQDLSERDVESIAATVKHLIES